MSVAVIRPMSLKVPRRARAIAKAIERFKQLNNGRPPTELQIIAEGRRMRAEGMHDMDLGNRTNLRNGLQRSWAGSKIYQTTWGPKGYAAIFIRVPGSPARWDIIKGFKP